MDNQSKFWKTQNRNIGREARPFTQAVAQHCGEVETQAYLLCSCIKFACFLLLSLIYRINQMLPTCSYSNGDTGPLKKEQPWMHWTHRLDNCGAYCGRREVLAISRSPEYDGRLRSGTSGRRTRIHFVLQSRQNAPSQLREPSSLLNGLVLTF